MAVQSPQESPQGSPQESPQEDLKDLLQDVFPPQSSQNLLRIYAYYRTLLGALLLFMQSNQFAPNILGSSRPEIFHYAALSYTALNAITLLILWRVRFRARQQQRFILFAIDILAIGTLVYASADASAGLSYLLVIAIAAGSMLLRKQVAIALAALATITIIAVNLLKPSQLDSQALFAAGSLGALLFITAAGFLYLTQKIKSSSEEARTQALQAAHSQKLAQMIVERMRTGIIVLDKHNNIAMMNKSAEHLLGLHSGNYQQALSKLPDLEEQLKIWRAFHHTQSPIFTIPGSPMEIKISFAELEPGADSDTLIFVEDNRTIIQKAQQLKLASLGRLTASIAHEVRNPLGAISHASQLLGEATTLAAADKRLTEIIQDHSLRVNQIIENVLQLSKRKAAEPKNINLQTWLEQFLEDYQASQSFDIRLDLHIQSSDIQAKFDLSQLRQILTNLIDNGLRHSFQETDQYHITLNIAVNRLSDAPYIDIIDDGSGVSDEDLKHIFEPFFTTETNGSGLGLFICKELCEANQASLSYRRNTDNASCFRLQFAHPQRTL